MDSEVLKLGIVGLTLALGWKGLDFLRWYIERVKPLSNGPAKPNGSSGAQSVDFWEKAFERIQRQVAIEAFTSVIAPMLLQQTSLFHDMKADLREMRDKIVEIAARRPV